MPTADTFTLFGPARWTPADGSRTFALALVANGHSFERRLVERKRPGLDGAPLDDAGSNPKLGDVFSVDCSAMGSIVDSSGI